MKNKYLLAGFLWVLIVAMTIVLFRYDFELIGTLFCGGFTAWLLLNVFKTDS